MSKVSLPYKWEPRPYQTAFWNAMLRGCDRAINVWHRRAGKDLTAFNWAVFDMNVLHPGGQWWHVWPTYEQGRKGWWDGADNEGRRFIDYIPKELIKRIRDDRMFLEMENGSIYRVVGADDPDRLVGANPVGLIMTEYSLHNPATWEYLRPILAGNEGTAIFTFTPRGRNHAHELFVKTKNNPRWFSSLQSIEDTGALPMSVLADEREAGMTEEYIAQEYYCDFTAPMSGAYYADDIKKAESEGRIRSVPHDVNLEVETWWDLGRRDANAIWFVQKYYDEYRIIDYEEDTNKSLDFWIKLLKEKPYIYSGHVAPHDIEVHEYTTGVSRKDFARKLGIDFTVAPKLSIQEGVDIVRRKFSTCYFDERNCWEGIEALKSYHKEWDEDRRIYKDLPVHNWATHAADAFRTGCVAGKKKKTKPLSRSYSVRYDPFKNVRRK
jgi:phage terminase large subunit